MLKSLRYGDLIEWLRKEGHPAVADKVEDEVALIRLIHGGRGTSKPKETAADVRYKYERRIREIQKEHNKKIADMQIEVSKLQKNLNTAVLRNLELEYARYEAYTDLSVILTKMDNLTPELEELRQRCMTMAVRRGSTHERAQNQYPGGN
jgi:uncharacterized protein YfkK (UPF0435 family)